MLSRREGYEQPKTCNGCGTGWSAKLVPNSIYGMGIKDVCCIHDDRFEFQDKSIEHLNMSNREFLNNLVRKINSDKKWWRNNFFIKKLMRSRAYIYYKAVDKFGASAYWDGKPNE